MDEANALVAQAADFGVPVSRAQAILNAAADAGGADTGAAAQRQVIEESPYFSVFKYFNRDGTPKKVNPTTGARLVLRDNGRIVEGCRRGLEPSGQRLRRGGRLGARHREHRP